MSRPTRLVHTLSINGPWTRVGALDGNDGPVLELDSEGTRYIVEVADLSEYSGIDTLLRLGVADDAASEGDEVDRYRRRVVAERSDVPEVGAVRKRMGGRFHIRERRCLGRVRGTVGGADRRGSRVRPS